MSVPYHRLKTPLLACALICLTAARAQENLAGKLAHDVAEKIVDGRQVLIVDDEEWPVVRPETKFITTIPCPSVKEHGYIVYQRLASDEVFEISAPRWAEHDRVL